MNNCNEMRRYLTILNENLHSIDNHYVEITCDKEEDNILQDLQDLIVFMDTYRELRGNSSFKDGYETCCFELSNKLRYIISKYDN